MILTKVYCRTSKANNMHWFLNSVILRIERKKQAMNSPRTVRV